MISPTTGELYMTAMEATSRCIDGIRAEQLHAATPCAEWDVQQVVNHIVGENLWAAELLQGKTIAQVGTRLDGDLTGDDAAAAYRESVRAATDAVNAPGAMETTCHLSFGDFSGAGYAAQLFMDTLIHGWDIATATGQDTRLDPRLVAVCLPIAQEITTMTRGSGAFGDALPVSEEADPQPRLLALVGRRA